MGRYWEEGSPLMLELGELGGSGMVEKETTWIGAQKCFFGEQTLLKEALKG